MAWATVYMSASEVLDHLGLPQFDDCVGIQFTWEKDKIVEVYLKFVGGTYRRMKLLASGWEDTDNL